MAKGRPNPSMMKNPKQHNLRGRLVEPDEVDYLELERFTHLELKEGGWTWLSLFQLNLKEGEGEVAFALEQGGLQIIQHQELELHYRQLTPIRRG